MSEVGYNWQLEEEKLNELIQLRDHYDQPGLKKLITIMMNQKG